MDYRQNRTRYPFDIGLSEDRTEQILTRYLEGVGEEVIQCQRGSWTSTSGPIGLSRHLRRAASSGS